MSQAISGASIRALATLLTLLAILIGPGGGTRRDLPGPAVVLASGTSLPRERAIWTAQHYATYEWYTSGSGFQQGVRYQWGGF